MGTPAPHPNSLAEAGALQGASRKPGPGLGTPSTAPHPARPRAPASPRPGSPWRLRSRSIMMCRCSALAMALESLGRSSSAGMVSVERLGPRAQGWGTDTAGLGTGPAGMPGAQRDRGPVTCGGSPAPHRPGGSRPLARRCAPAAPGAPGAGPSAPPPRAPLPPRPRSPGPSRPAFAALPPPLRVNLRPRPASHPAAAPNSSGRREGGSALGRVPATPKPRRRGTERPRRGLGEGVYCWLFRNQSVTTVHRASRPPGPRPPAGPRKSSIVWTWGGGGGETPGDSQ